MIDAVVQFRNYNEEYPDFRSLMLLLHENGYSSLLIGNLQQILNDLSKHFSLNPSEIDFLFGSSGEILTKEEPEVLFFLDEHRRRPVVILTEEGEELPIRLEICCLAPDEKTGRSEIKKIIKVIKNTAKIRVVSFTWGSIDQQKAEDKISKMVKGLSTNGKFLTDIQIKEMCKHLRKERVREILLGLTRIETVPIPLDSVEFLHEEYKIEKKALVRELESLVECRAVSRYFDSFVLPVEH